MSSFPGGGGRAYVIDLDAVVKSSSSSPATSAWSTHSSSSSSSSPSASLSESRGHPLAISTKRARAPRKRPNQAYDEAAALLATAYPGVFSAKGLLDLCKKNGSLFYAEPTAELLPPCPVLGDASFLLQEYVPSEQRLLTRPTSSSERSWACRSPGSSELQEPNSPAESGDVFDADTIILDGEVGEGIDSIMGNLDMNTNSPSSGNEASPSLWSPPAYGHGDCGRNMRRALRRGTEDGDWWRCRTVEVLDINPELNPALPHPGPPSTSKKKKKKVEKAQKDKLDLGLAASSSPTQLQRAAADNKARLGLRLDYKEVLKAWSGRGSPFSDPGDSSEFPAGAIVMLSQVELHLDEEVVAVAASPGGEGGEYDEIKEKRKSQLFSRRIWFGTGPER